MMKLEIESTDTIIKIQGVEVRLWRGWTASGIPCAVFVHRIAVLHTDDETQFEAELRKQSPPVLDAPLNAALAEWLQSLPHLPYRGEAEHPEGYDGPCLCDSCVQDAVR